MNEKEFFEVAFDNSCSADPCFKLIFIEALLKINFKLKSKKAGFSADARILNIYILLPRRELCKRLELFDYRKNKEGFINDLLHFLNEEDRYPSYIIYLAESDGKHFFADGELNFINEISDEVLQQYEQYDVFGLGVFDSDDCIPNEVYVLGDCCPLWHCDVFDNKKYALQYNPLGRGISAPTFDLVKQIFKMTVDYAEMHEIMELPLVFKLIRYRYDELFFGKTEDEILNMDFAELVMFWPAYVCLSRYGVRTIGEIMKLTDEDFPCVHRLGKLSIESVKQIQKDVAELLEFCRTQQMTENSPPLF